MQHQLGTVLGKARGAGKALEDEVAQRRGLNACQNASVRGIPGSVEIRLARREQGRFEVCIVWSKAEGMTP